MGSRLLDGSKEHRHDRLRRLARDLVGKRPRLSLNAEELGEDVFDGLGRKCHEPSAIVSYDEMHPLIRGAVAALAFAALGSRANPIAARRSAADTMRPAGGRQ